MINHFCDFYKITKESLKDQLIKSNIKQQTIQQVILKSYSPQIQKKLTLKLVRYIISCVQPISIVENNEFRLWTKGLDPQFEVSCVNTIKTIIFNSYTSATRQITDLISKTSDTISLTFDIWTSRAHNSYLGITYHWLMDSF